MNSKINSANFPKFDILFDNETFTDDKDNKNESKI